MTTWNEPWDYEYKKDINGEGFARVVVSISAEEKRGYFDPDWTSGNATFYVHEQTGIVTADPLAFREWLSGIVTRAQIAAVTP